MRGQDDFVIGQPGPLAPSSICFYDLKQGEAEGHWLFALHSRWGCVPGHWTGVQRGLGIAFQGDGRNGMENTKSGLE